MNIVKEPVPGKNNHYVGNGPNLVPLSLIKLPVGSIKPSGWLREILIRQKNGLCGQLSKISKWLQRDDNAWLSENGEGKWGWEEVPYWLRGFISMAYILDDKELIKEANFWIEATLNSVRSNGDFGPNKISKKTNKRDHWSNMVMLNCLQTYYEKYEDDRVMDLMEKYFAHLLTLESGDILNDYWDKARGGDMLQSIIWYYNRTFDKDVLPLIGRIHNETMDWCQENDLPSWHNVNIAQGFREPASYYQYTKDSNHLKATYNDFNIAREKYGDVPGGMFGGDENCRKGYEDPRQGVETCGMAEQMYSDQILLQITGDTFWAENCEDVAFNTYTAAIMPDMKSLRYITAPNHVISDCNNHHPGIDNKGPFLMMNPFSSRCCQHNHSFGWPYFCENLVYATPDNGLAFMMYSESEVEAKVGQKNSVKVSLETNYPFEPKLKFKVVPESAEKFPLYFRIPTWCDSFDVKIDSEEKSMAHKDDHYLVLDQDWDPKGTEIEITFNEKVELVTHKKHNAFSIKKGPLTYSLDIKEEYIQRDSTETAIWDSGWQETADPSVWPSFEIYPNCDWAFGVKKNVLDYVEVHSQEVKDSNPFTKEGSPVYMTAKASAIKNWLVDEHLLCGCIPEKLEVGDDVNIKLYPMGCCNLRISVFPEVK